MINHLINIILTALSASFLILSYPGFGIHFLAWVAMVPLFLLIKRSGILTAVLSSLAVGFLFFSAIVLWGLRIGGYNLFNFSFQHLVIACYFSVFILIVRYFNKKIPRWNALTFPTAWVIIEYLRTHMGFLSWPWGVLGYSQYSFLPVAQISAFTGVYGVSFLIIMVNTVLAEILCPYLFRIKPEGSPKTHLPVMSKTLSFVLAFALVLFSASFLYAVKFMSEKEDIPNLRVALIQGNVYKFKYNDPKLRNDIFMNYLMLSSKAAKYGPELIAWPSSSVPGVIPYERGFTSRLSTFAKNSGKFLLVGGCGHDKLSKSTQIEGDFANSAFLFAPNGKIVDRYDKVRLLPFDEYLPLRHYIKWPSWIVSPDMTDARRGEELTVFKMGGQRFGTLICWESMFPDQFRKTSSQGVDFMVNMTNEAFTDDLSAHYQMLAMNVFRAVENHVSIVRISTTGVSGIIGPDGRIISRVEDENMNDVNVEGYLVEEMPLSSKRSFYNRYGDWFVCTLSIVFAGSFLFALIANTRNDRGDEGE